MKKHAKLWIAAALLLLAGTVLLGRLPERWTAARFQRQCRAADVERITLRLQEMGGGEEITVADPAVPGHTCGYLYPRHDRNFYPVSNTGALFAAADANCGEP